MVITCHQLFTFLGIVYLLFLLNIIFIFFKTYINITEIPGRTEEGGSASTCMNVGATIALYWTDTALLT